MSATRETATLAGGCFWCLEAVFQPLKGVDRVVSGYTGGAVGRPTYEDVCTGTTGHAEAVQVTFDPAVLSYRQLLELFFAFHDPTTMNRQGADVGPQYRSSVFYHTAEQERVARDLIADLEREGVFPDPIVTEVVKLREWYPAEEYHQAYFGRNPERMYCRAVIAPKVAKLRGKYAELVRG
jgi:peptide-methionine (S)-S-oxide reductase